MEAEMILNVVFAVAAAGSAIAALIAALRAGRAEEGVRVLTVEVNSRLDELIKGARARGEVQGRKDERSDREEDKD